MNMIPQNAFAGFRLMPRRTNDLYVSYCGMEACVPGKYYQDEVRLEYVVHFIINGKGLFRLHGQEYRLGSSQAFLIPPGTADYYYEADKNDPFFYIWIGFGGGQSSAYLERTGLSVSDPVCTLAQGSEPFYSELSRLLTFRSSSRSDELKRTGSLCHLLSLLIHSSESLRNDPMSYQYPSQVYVQYAIEYIRAANGRTHIAEIARHVGIDRSYLHNIFKKHLGLSPQEYLLSYRLKLSCRLLLETALPLQEIAHQIGYEDAAGYSRMFKKQYGMSPSGYRKTMHASERRCL